MRGRVHRQRGAEGNDDIGPQAGVAVLLQLAAGARKTAAPQAAQIERQDDPVDAFDRMFKTLLELAELAVAADGTFREQAHHLAGLQQGIDLLRRLLAVTAGNRDHAEEIQEPFQIPALIDALVHDKTDRAWAGDLDHGPVQPTDVIAKHQHTALAGQVVEAQYLDAVTAGEQTCGHIAYQ